MSGGHEAKLRPVFGKTVSSRRRAETSHGWASIETFSSNLVRVPSSSRILRGEFYGQVRGFPV